MYLCCKKGGAPHMTTLEDLYYGNISPHEKYIKRGTRVDKLVKLISVFNNAAGDVRYANDNYAIQY